MARRSNDPTAVPYPRLYDLILRALRDRGGTASVSEQLELVISYTDFAGDVEKLRHRLAWARTRLKGAGLVSNVGLGQWQLTERGLSTESVDWSEISAAKDSLIFPPPVLRESRFFSRQRAQAHLYSTVEIVFHVQTALGDEEVQSLTPDYLANELVPFLRALNDLQEIISYAWQLPVPPIALTRLSRSAPKLTFEGSGEILEGVLKHTVPWRKKNFKKMEELKIAEQQAEIEKRLAEKQEFEARKTEIDSKSEERKAEAEVHRARARSIEMDCELKQVQITGEKWRLALQMVDDIYPNATAADKAVFAQRLMGPIKTIVESELTAKVVDIDKSKLAEGYTE